MWGFGVLGFCCFGCKVLGSCKVFLSLVQTLDCLGVTGNVSGFFYGQDILTALSVEATKSCQHPALATCRKSV